MLPFDIRSQVSVLTGQYPDVDLLRSVLPIMTLNEREKFLRLWVAEGIPFAFKELPMLYGYVREWLSKQLNVPQEDITMIGSGRIGFSLSKGANYGIPFRPESDLDISIINPLIFGKLQAVFSRWKNETKEGIVHPRNPTEKGYWDENIIKVPNNIRMGFLDIKKIPYLYKESSEIAHSMWLLKKKLDITKGAPRVRDASIRIYEDWNSFLNQMGRNLNVTAKSLSK